MTFHANMWKLSLSHVDRDSLLICKLIAKASFKPMLIWVDLDSARSRFKPGLMMWVFYIKNRVTRWALIQWLQRLYKTPLLAGQYLSEALDSGILIFFGLLHLIVIAPSLLIKVAFGKLTRLFGSRIPALRLPFLLHFGEDHDVLIWHMNRSIGVISHLIIDGNRLLVKAADAIHEIWFHYVLVRSGSGRLLEFDARAAATLAGHLQMIDFIHDEFLNGSLIAVNVRICTEYLDVLGHVKSLLAAARCLIFFVAVAACTCLAVGDVVWGRGILS